MTAASIATSSKTGKAVSHVHHDHVGEHAVVLGASMAGLLAARVLSEHFGAVTVIERDQLSDAAEPRRGYRRVVMSTDCSGAVA